MTNLMNVMARSRARARLVAGAVVLAAVCGACAPGYAPTGSPAATDLAFSGCQIGPQPGAPVREGDPSAPGQPMAGVPIDEMRPRQVGDLARSRGLAVTWRLDWDLGGQRGFSECWCIPPELGRVTDLAYGLAGELVVFVDSDRAVAAPREQPPRGWGC